MAKKTKAVVEVFTNRTALSLAKGIPIDHLKAAKALSCPGASSSGRWTWDEFHPWYQKNKQSIVEYLEDNQPSQDRDYWKERKEKAQALIAEIQLQELQGNTLNRQKAIASAKQMLGSMANILKSMAQDYPHKLLGKDITGIQLELTKFYDEFCGKGTESLEKWAKK